MRGALLAFFLTALVAIPALTQQDPQQNQQKNQRVRPRDKYPRKEKAPEPEPGRPERKQQPSQKQEPLAKVDSNEALFDVLAAINAAGYDEGADSPTNDPLRKALRDYVAKQDPRSVDALRRFVRDHRPRDPHAELNQYISFALLTKGPPDFAFANPDLPLPPEVVPLDGFAPLLANFYKEANLAELWKRAQPSYEMAMDKITGPVADGLLQVDAYMRNVTSGFLGRRFLVYVDLLGGPNQVQTRNYIDDYYVVVTPSQDLPVADVRHAFLHFMVDPLVLKYSDNIKKKSALHEIALDSPLLEENYRQDFIQLAGECFIKAIESRIERRPAMAEEALREGYILTPAFAELLMGYEKQEEGLRLYFPDLVDALNVKNEQTRLAHVDFLKERPVRTVQAVVEVNAKPVLTGAEKTLDLAEQAYTARDLDKAKATYLKVLEETSEKPLHAKAYYGLARVAVLQRDPETGDRLFRKVLELEPDAATKSWSLLYLGRLADSQGDRDEAQQHYKEALAVEGAPESVRQAAEKGIQEAFKK